MKYGAQTSGSKRYLFAFANGIGLATGLCGNGTTTFDWQNVCLFALDRDGEELRKKNIGVLKGNVVDGSRFAFSVVVTDATAKLRISDPDNCQPGAQCGILSDEFGISDQSWQQVYVGSSAPIG